jgi:uncharacterized membrane protein
MSWGYGPGLGGWLMMGAGWLLFLLVIIALVVWLFPGTTLPQKVVPPTPLEVLNARLARGEVDLDRYHMLKEEIIRDVSAPR